MYHKVISPFGIDEVSVAKSGIFQKISEQIFVKFFVFGGVEALQELQEFVFELVDVGALRLDFQKGFVERFADIEGIHKVMMVKWLKMVTKFSKSLQ